VAPRDVVARAIAREGMGATPGESRQVNLDMRHVTNFDLHQRFPGISAFLAQQGLDLCRDLIPIRPAAHYLMGGIRADLNGRTTVPGRSTRVCVRSSAWVLRPRISMRCVNTRTSTRLPMGAGRPA